jgi:flagellar hook assembly protein FlgD
VTIYDVSGRVVRTIHQKASAAGDLVLRWDGRDEQGKSAAAGTYYYRVKTSAGEASRRMIWLR